MRLPKFITFGRLNFFLFLVILIGFLVLLLVPIEPIKVSKVDLLTKQVRAGEEITYVIEFCKNVDSDILGEVDRFLVDTKNDKTRPIELSGSQANGPKGCRKLEIGVLLPLNVPESTYRLRFVYKYYPSLFRPPIVVTVEPKDFLVVKKADIRGSLQKITKQLAEIEKELTTPPQVSAATTEEPSKTYDPTVDSGGQVNAPSNSQPQQTFPAPSATTSQPQVNSRKPEADDDINEEDRSHLAPLLQYVFHKLRLQQ